MEEKKQIWKVTPVLTGDFGMVRDDIKYRNDYYGLLAVVQEKNTKGDSAKYNIEMEIQKYRNLYHRYYFFLSQVDIKLLWIPDLEILHCVLINSSYA